MGVRGIGVYGDIIIISVFPYLYGKCQFLSSNDAVSRRFNV